jgi:formylglycine-generating enzyme required for sulfatase activity
LAVKAMASFMGTLRVNFFANPRVFRIRLTILFVIVSLLISNQTVFSQTLEKPVVAHITNSIGMELVVPPGGSVFIGKTEVTQAQWLSVMPSNPVTGSYIGPKKPINLITFQDACDFCIRLGKIEKRHYRLPTQDEWRTICHLGTYTNVSAQAVAWCFPFSAPEGIHEVATKKPDRFGIYDLHGNVSEWCLNKIGDEKYLVDFIHHKKTPVRKVKQIAMGGGYMSSPAQCGCDEQIVYNAKLDDDISSSLIGFRVVREK